MHNDESDEISGEELEAAAAVLDKAIAQSVIKLTEDEFIDRYKPETDPDGNYYRQRDWTDYDDLESIREAEKENRLWTALDDDNGNFCIVSGWHYVNRLYYIITEVPIADPDQAVEVRDDYDDVPEHLQQLMFETDTNADEWESMDGPETGVGVEYWYRHISDGREAYIVDDQGEITLEVSEGSPADT